MKLATCTGIVFVRFSNLIMKAMPLVHRHGDMLFLDMDQDITSVSEISSMDSTPTLTSTGESSASLSSMSSRPSFTSRDVVADTVDQFLWNQDGKIPRQRNEQLYAFVYAFDIMYFL